MPARENPLETLGIPRFIVEHELGLGPAGLERLKALCARVARAETLLYHDDVGLHRNRELLDRIDAAAATLDDVTAVHHYARRLLGLTGSTHTVQAQALAAGEAASAANGYAALKRLVPYIDTAAVLVRENAEVILGHRQRYGGKAEDDFDGLYALSVERSGLGMFAKLHHPVIDGLPGVMSRLQPPSWNVVVGEWRAQFMEFVDDVPAMQPHVFGRTDLYGARLVGGITPSDARRLTPPIKVQAAARELMGGTAAESSSDPTWFTVNSAWWLEAMFAPVEVGDIAVVVNDGTGLIALGGEILAIHDHDM